MILSFTNMLSSMMDDHFGLHPSRFYAIVQVTCPQPLDSTERRAHVTGKGVTGLGNLSNLGIFF